MDTQLVKIDDIDRCAKQIQKAAQIIKDGGLVAFPTETVYGLGGDGMNPEASGKIYAAKGRPSDNPLIMHIANKEDLYELSCDVTKTALALADKFWPGPLTMILKKKNTVPLETTGGLDTVAIRMPNHPVAKALILESGRYIAAPSANTSGRPSPTKAEHVYEDLNGKIPMILDGGEVGIGIESTIVDLTEEIPVILRPGYLTKEMMETVISTVIMDPALMEVKSDAKPKAPGMKYRHYAPKADLKLVRGERDAVVDAINQYIKIEEAGGKQIGVICCDETKNCYPSATVRSLGSRTKEADIARHLFDILRQFDSINVDLIYSECFDDMPGIGQAVMNRLLKAAGHQVIELS